ncbi:hypothetical protein B0T17DRAFT_566229 [Bombardia bombarda]|uniref:Uncharacterized protein n=1 Tax=Bombardia bombarda TaxID=252184 RepID=A0AA39TQT7_9PEZI|nr:hypothetical protein B0T17DRAFT_566229 [Bombardia bombarda]
MVFGPVMEPKQGVLPFIVSTSVGKTDQDTRKLIRSHVMRGKNLGKSRPAKERSRAPRYGRDHGPKGEDNSRDKGQPPAALTTTFHSRIPPKVGSDYSLQRFVETIEPSVVAEVMQCKYIHHLELVPACMRSVLQAMVLNNYSTAPTVSAIAKRTLFAVDTLILFDKGDHQFVEPMAYDNLYLHVVVCTTRDYLDMLFRRKDNDSDSSSCYNKAASPQTWPHFAKAISLLRERLALGDDAAKISDATVQSVLGLAVHAHIVGKTEAARFHIEGLRKMVTLRGGIMVFKGRLKLLIEMLRCDVGIALHSGTKPLFFRDPSFEPLLPLPYQSPPPNSSPLLPTIHPSLRPLFTTLSRFSSHVNATSASLKNTTNDNSRLLPKSLLFSTLGSVTYRLLFSAFPSGTLNEAIRLGLLAFCSSVFLQWRGLKRPRHYVRFPDAFRECLVGGTSGVDLLGAEPGVWVWLLMMGAVGVFEDVEWIVPWLRHNMDAVALGRGWERERRWTWEEMKEVLDGFVWIGVAHDEQGRRVFERAMRS